MILNIKDPEAHELAEKLVRETGGTLTSAVIESLRERLGRITQLRQQASADELLAIGRRCAKERKGQGRAAPHGDMLYDALGLPR